MNPAQAKAGAGSTQSSSTQNSSTQGSVIFDKVSVVFEQANLVAVSEFSLNVAPGEFVSVVGPSRLRQDHPAEFCCRPAARRRRPRQAAGERQTAGHRHARCCLHARARCAGAVAHRTRQCRARRRSARRACGQAPGTRTRSAGEGRPERLRRRLSEGAVAGHAPARRARAHVFARFADPADGRTVRRARCADEAAAGRRAALALAARAAHRHLHYPRPVGSRVDVGSGYRHELAAGPHHRRRADHARRGRARCARCRRTRTITSFTPRSGPSSKRD